MPANHQTLKNTQAIPTNGVVCVMNTSIRVPTALIFRRLYLGAHWITGLQNRFFTVKLEFLNGGKADGYDMTFGWRSSPHGKPVNDAPSNMNYSWFPEFPICPPYSVEAVPLGSTTDFVSAAPAQADEMIASSADFNAEVMRNIRMLPIPIAVKCDEIRAYVQHYNADGTGITGAYSWFEFFLGCRSSDYAL